MNWGDLHHCTCETAAAGASVVDWSSTNVRLKHLQIKTIPTRLARSPARTLTQRPPVKQPTLWVLIGGEDRGCKKCCPSSKCPVGSKRHCSIIPGKPRPSTPVWLRVQEHTPVRGTTQGLNVWRLFNVEVFWYRVLPSHLLTSDSWSRDFRQESSHLSQVNFF